MLSLIEKTLARRKWEGSIFHTLWRKRFFLGTSWKSREMEFYFALKWQSHIKSFVIKFHFNVKYFQQDVKRLSNSRIPLCFIKSNYQVTDWCIYWFFTYYKIKWIILKIIYNFLTNHKAKLLYNYFNSRIFNNKFLNFTYRN